MKLLFILSLLLIGVDSAPLDLVDALIEEVAEEQGDAVPFVDVEKPDDAQPDEAPLDDNALIQAAAEAQKAPVVEDVKAVDPSEVKPEDELERFLEAPLVAPVPETDAAPAEAYESPESVDENAPIVNRENDPVVTIDTPKTQETVAETPEETAATTEIENPNNEESEPSFYSEVVDLKKDSEEPVDEEAAAASPAQETAQVLEDSGEEAPVDQQPEEPVQPVSEVQQKQQVPVEAVPTNDGSTATVDGVTVRFLLQATWAVPGGRRRGYTVSITNGGEKNVCGVTFMPNSKTSDLFNLSTAEDGSLSTKDLHLAMDETVNKFGYISFDRSLPTIIAVTYC